MHVAPVVKSFGFLGGVCLSILSASMSFAWAQKMDCYIEETLCFPIPERRTDFVKDELLLLFDESFSDDQYQALLKKKGLDELDSSSVSSLKKNLIRVSTNGKDPLTLEKEINRVYYDVEAATNNIYQLGGMTTKSLAADLYPKSLTGAKEALEFSRGKGVLIGMIDGPVDTTHPSFGGRVEQDMSLVGGNQRSLAKLLHGTTIAGVLASRHAAIGIAPEANIYSVVAFNRTDKSFSSNSGLVAKAIDMAIKKKVDILNLSFAGGSDALVKKLIKKAIAKGIIVVASCGNDSSKKPYYPAAIEGVIAVTAVDSQKHVYGKANHGKYIDVAAPGVNILSTAPGSRYDLSTGTSFAAANVSGSLALLLAKKKRINRTLLLDTATDLGVAGKDEAFGYGLINVLQAFKAIQ